MCLYVPTTNVEHIFGQTIDGMNFKFLTHTVPVLDYQTEPFDKVYCKLHLLSCNIFKGVHFCFVISLLTSESGQ